MHIVHNPPSPTTRHLLRTLACAAASVRSRWRVVGEGGL